MARHGHCQRVEGSQLVRSNWQGSVVDIGYSGNSFRPHCSSLGRRKLQVLRDLANGSEACWRPRDVTSRTDSRSPALVTKQCRLANVPPWGWQFAPTKLF